MTNGPASSTLLALNKTMLEIYDEALQHFQTDLLQNTPIILALFSGAGGQMLLFRPGHTVQEAPLVPVAYQYFKSVGHSPLVMYELATTAKLSDTFIWQQPMRSYLISCEEALGRLSQLELAAADYELLSHVLCHNLTYMYTCLNQNRLTLDGLREFAHHIASHLALTIKKAAEIQVSHWMSVLEQWQKELGSDWTRLYAASNTLYVTRRNNVLFSLLAQFMGEAAIGRRLLLFETSEFTTTPQELLGLLSRVVSDRSLGQTFFNCYHLTDTEVLGGAARAAIISETEKRGMQPTLPSLAPVHTTEWPWQTQPGSGPSTLEDTLS